MWKEKGKGRTANSQDDKQTSRNVEKSEKGNKTKNEEVCLGLT